MPEDRFGLPLTTASEAAAQHYRDGTDRLLSAWGGAADAFAAAVAADPGFAAAHAWRARALAVHGRAAEARAAHAAALAHRDCASAREQSQIEVLGHALAGRAAAAIAAAEAHLSDHPRDALVLAMLLGAFGLLAFSGRADHDAARVALCGRLAPHYDGDWWFPAMHGWALIEAGRIVDGLPLVEVALDRRAANGNAVHIHAHAHYDAHEASAAAVRVHAFLPAYDPDGPLYSHLAWHLALAALDAGDLGQAQAIHARYLAPGMHTGPPITAVTDAASLLWRLMLREAPPHVADWTALIARLDAAFPRAGLAFADVHAAMIDSAAGRREVLEARLAALDALIGDGRLQAGPVAPAICRGLAAFAAGAWDEAADRLVPLLPEVVRIGGSGAQRDVIEETAIAACLRAGRAGTARAILRRRDRHQG